MISFLSNFPHLHPRLKYWAEPCPDDIGWLSRKSGLPDIWPHFIAEDLVGAEDRQGNATLVHKQDVNWPKPKSTYVPKPKKTPIEKASKGDAKLLAILKYLDGLSPEEIAALKQTVQS